MEYLHFSASPLNDDGEKAEREVWRGASFQIGGILVGFWLFLWESKQDFGLFKNRKNTFTFQKLGNLCCRFRYLYPPVV